ncbi:NAC domain-containing protein 71-like [Citrus sinensis]|uniref:NAC domain-containing protein 71-like n=2 Tax=Citrus TaxID=2706 RepID=UPI00227965BF|nr:NAC domain-containing protein 71-like [Citrus sinensis]
MALPLLQTKLDSRSSYSLILVLRFSCRVLNQKLMDSLVGFRFHPTDEEIILLLTMKRRDPAGFSVRTIKEIDLYSFEPWELPWHSDIQSEEEVWYFFCEPYYKYTKSKRVHRRTKEGYWKKTGRGSNIKRKYKTEVIGTKKILSFSRDDAAAEKDKTEWVIHEIAVEDSPDYKKDFVVCRLERKREKKTLGVVSTKRKRETKTLGVVSTKRKRDKKLGVSTSDGDQSCQNLTSKRSHVAEDTNRNHVAEKVNLVSTRNHVAENIGLVPEPQGRDHSISCYRNHVAEKMVEDSVEAETRRLAELNRRGDGFDGRNDTSVSAVQSSDYPEQESSDCNGSSCGSGLLNSQLDGGQVDVRFSSRRDFQNEYSPEETGETTPDFFKSKSDEGVYVEDGSDANPETESFNEWVNIVFDYQSSVSGIC